jgi:hypothetical protein
MRFLKETIKVIHEKDIEDLLDEYKIKEPFMDGNISCELCKQPMNINNICAFRVVKNQLKFICSNLSCYENLVNFKRGDKNI